MPKRRIALSLLLLVVALTPAVPAQNGKPENGAEKKEEKKKDFPDFDTVVTDEFDTRSGFLTLHYSEKSQSLFAAIPKSLLGKEFLLATSISGGRNRGFQAADWLLRFERQDKQLLLFAPNTQQIGGGSFSEVVKETYPDALIATIPIRTQNGSGDPVIDMKGFLAGNATRLSSYYGGRGGVIEIPKAKAFEDNCEIELRFLSAMTSSTHFSFSRLRSSKSFKPRRADQRVGYFLSAQQDFSKDERADTTFDRYINRWHLEKAEKSLSLSPPAQPIIFYVEKTVPVKYRRWVREGIEVWNEAFEEIGIVDAIEVRQQTGSNEFSKYDPEDSQYNFFRWIASGRAFAMGPSRVNPRTGEILDADIIFDESMLRFYLREHDLLVASLNIDDLSPRLRQYLAENPHEHPNWKRLRTHFLAEQRSSPGAAPEMTPEEWFADLMIGQNPIGAHQNTCNIGEEFRRKLAFSHLAMSLAPAIAQDAEAADNADEEEEVEAAAETEAADDAASDDAAKDEEADEEEDEAEDSDDENGDDDEKEEEKKKSPFEEWPEELVGQILREIVAHEVGHTLGLRHNFKASSWKSIEEIMNPEDLSAPTVASVMDYNPLQLNPDGTPPALWTTPTIGPYDTWAIEYGYAIPGTGDRDGNEEKMLKAIAARSSEPGLDYLTDEDTSGPDPLTFRFDLGSDPMVYSERQLALASNVIDHILKTYVRDDDSFDRARRAFATALSEHLFASYIAARWIGAHYIHRDQKDTTDARPPIVVVEAEKQREAFELLKKYVFAPDAFEIDPVLQQHLAASRWYHWGSRDWYNQLTYPIQDTILSIQETILFRLLNIDTVNNLYDSEFRVDAETDLFTLPELLQGLTETIWAELAIDGSSDTEYSVRKPMIGSLRRNLQRSYTSELIEMAIRDEDSWYPAISRTLAWKQLKDLGTAIEAVLATSGGSLDAYTSAHLEETRSRIAKALDASFQINAGSGGGGFMIFLSGQEAAEKEVVPVPNGSAGFSPGQYLGRQ